MYREIYEYCVFEYDIYIYIVIGMYVVCICKFMVVN